LQSNINVHKTALYQTKQSNTHRQNQEASLKTELYNQSIFTYSACLRKQILVLARLLLSTKEMNRQ